MQTSVKRIKRTLAIAVAILSLTVPFATRIHAQDSAGSTEAIVSASAITISNASTAGTPAVSTFSKANGGHVVVAVRVQNNERVETAVHITIVPATRAVEDVAKGVRLAVPAQRSWRTFARFTVARPAGAYLAVIHDEAGNVIGTSEFSITE